VTAWQNVGVNMNLQIADIPLMLFVVSMAITVLAFGATALPSLKPRSRAKRD
jgi:hypothetical protein